MSKITLLPLLLASLGVVALPACQNTPSSSSGHAHTHAHGSDAGAQAKVLLTVPAKTDGAQSEENLTLEVPRGGTAEITLHSRQAPDTPGHLPRIPTD